MADPGVQQSAARASDSGSSTTAGIPTAVASAASVLAEICSLPGGFGELAFQQPAPQRVQSRAGVVHTGAQRRGSIDTGIGAREQRSAHRADHAVTAGLPAGVQVVPARLEGSALLPQQ